MNRTRRDFQMDKTGHGGHQDRPDFCANLTDLDMAKARYADGSYPASFASFLG